MVGVIMAFTPTVGFTWPALLPIALGVGATLGYKLIEDSSKVPTLSKLTRKLQNTTLIQLDLQKELSLLERPINLELLEDEVGAEQYLRFQKGKVIVAFKRDSRGKLGIDVLGPKSIPEKVLKEQGIEFAREVVRAFAADRVVRELEKTNAVVVDEKMTENEDMVLKLRRWV